MRFKTYLKRRFTAKTILILAGIVTVLTLVVSTPPTNFPSKAFTFTIKKNSGLSSTADLLKDKGLIRSAFVYKVFGVLLGGRHSLKAGEYLFDAPEASWHIAWRQVRGVHGLDKVRVTIPEGSSSQDIAWLILKQIPEFDAPAFLALAKPHEGYLFPDTYFFYPDVSSEEALRTLLDTYDDKTKTYRAQFEASGRNVDDVVKMASIVEKEALSLEDRKIVAGILWKRIDTGMALQVDFPFYYLYGKTSADLTSDDLKRDTPYNLYTNKGLPPTPISNPGLSALEATLNPADVPYWYYLSDKDGKMHYASTFNGHIANKQMYLW